MTRECGNRMLLMSAGRLDEPDAKFYINLIEIYGRGADTHYNTCWCYDGVTIEEAFNEAMEGDPDVLGLHVPMTDSEVWPPDGPHNLAGPFNIVAPGAVPLLDLVKWSLGMIEITPLFGWGPEEDEPPQPGPEAWHAVEYAEPATEGEPATRA